jgi:hypothetical protein
LLAVATAAGVLSAAGAGPAQPAAAAGLAAKRSLAQACNTSAATARGCDLASLRAIDAVRSGEALPPLALPPDYEDLDMVQQLVVVTNAERAARGLPAWHGPDRALGQLVVQAISAGQDPTGPAGTTWASNIATGVLTVLQADYEWMYNDGPGGTNAGCTAANRSQCWDHRANILSPWAGTIGAAEQPTNAPRLVVGEIMVASS